MGSTIRIDTPPNYFEPGEVGDTTFLGLFRKYIGNISDAPKSFVELSGLFCLSSIAKKISIQYDGKTNPNCFFMIIGPTTYGRKGTMSKAICNMLSTYIRTEEPVLPYKEIGISSSAEGFLRSIKDANEHAYIVAEEYHGELKSYLKREHYKSEMLQWLLKIYDGVSLQHTRSSSEQSIHLQHPYVSLFSDIQPSPLADHMSSEFTTKGFFQRFIVSHDKVWKEKPMHKFTEEDMDLALSAKYLLKMYKDDLVKMGTGSDEVVATLDDDAANSLIQYHEEFKSLGSKYQEESDVNAFYTRAQENLKRIAALYALNDLDIGGVWETGKAKITIKGKHVDCAYRVIINSIRSWEQFFPFISSDDINRNKKIMFFILKQSEARGESYISVRDIFADLGVKMTELDFGKMIDTVKVSDGLVAIDIEMISAGKLIEDSVIDIDNIRERAKKRLSKVGLMTKTNFDRIIREREEKSNDELTESLTKQLDIKMLVEEE